MDLKEKVYMCIIESFSHKEEQCIQLVIMHLNDWIQLVVNMLS